VKLFHPSRTARQISGWDEVIFPAYENSQKQMPAINSSDQTMGFDHVGHHHQPDLPPALPELPGRRAYAEEIAS
jgi:hypothetical protein